MKQYHYNSQNLTNHSSNQHYLTHFYALIKIKDIVRLLLFAPILLFNITLCFSQNKLPYNLEVFLDTSCKLGIDQIQKQQFIDGNLNNKIFAFDSDSAIVWLRVTLYKESILTNSEVVISPYSKVFEITKDEKIQILEPKKYPVPGYGYPKAYKLSCSYFTEKTFYIKERYIPLDSRFNSNKPLRHIPSISIRKLDHLKRIKDEQLEPDSFLLLKTVPLDSKELYNEIDSRSFRPVSLLDSIPLNHKKSLILKYQLSTPSEGGKVTIRLEDNARIIGAYAIGLQQQKKFEVGHGSQKLSISTYKNEKISILVNIAPKHLRFLTYPISIRYNEDGPFKVNQYKSAIVKTLGNSFMVTLFFLCLFFLVQYIFNTDQDYLLYFVYLLSLAIFFFHLNFGREFHPYSDHSSNMSLFSIIWFPISIATYLIFINSFLNIKKKSSKMYAIIKGILISIGIGLICVYLSNSVQLGLKILAVIGIIVSPAFLFLFYYILKQWNKEDWGVNFIIIGSTLLFFTSFLYSIAGLTFLFKFSIFQNSSFVQFIKADISTHQNIFILKMSMLIEILLFSSALGLKSRQHEIKKGEAEKQLLQNQLIAQKKEADLQLKVANAEQKALKAQMNPHFMSNCLNSIKLLIQQEENDNAEKYLVKFSKLIRGVVDYSQETSITLNKEIQFCELYMAMEALRFGDQFNFEIEVMDSIDTSFYNIPPFILQPLLENALWHGLLRKKGHKSIRILIFNSDDLICCMVDDSGIGLEAANNHKSKKSFAKKSVGIKNTKERLDLFKEISGTEVSLEIIDKTNSAGHSEGVIAVLTIPQ